MTTTTKPNGLPGYTAEAALYRTSKPYYMAVTPGWGGVGGIRPALRRDVWRPTRPANTAFGGSVGFSACQLGCDAAYALCPAGCTGISGGVGVALCVVACSAAYQACIEGCK